MLGVAGGGISSPAEGDRAPGSPKGASSVPSVPEPCGPACSLRWPCWAQFPSAAPVSAPHTPICLQGHLGDTPDPRVTQPVSSALASPAVEDEEDVTGLEMPEEYRGCLGASDKQALGVPSLPGTTTCRYVVVPRCRSFRHAQVGWGGVGWVGCQGGGTSAPHDSRVPPAHLCPTLPRALGLDPRCPHQHLPAAPGAPAMQGRPGLDRCRQPARRKDPHLGAPCFLPVSPVPNPGVPASSHNSQYTT